MAKSKSEPSQAQKDADTAREKVKAATAAAAKNNGPAAATALAQAKVALNHARKVENEDRFKRVGNPRLSMAVKAIKNVGKLAAAASYEYTDDHISKIEIALTKATSEAVTALRTAKNKTPGKSAATETYF
jgi:hypothetical protein